MKKLLKVLLLIAALLAAAIAALAVKLWMDGRRQAEDQARMVKTDEELLGEHVYLPRTGGEDVDVNLYRPDDGERRALVVNIHGGAFIAGDADTLDTQSDRISRDWNVCVAAVNYKLARAPYSIDYGTGEIVDTVQYFRQHAEEYRIDPDRIYLLGYSAGAYHAMAAALTLCREGVSVAGQILCYGFLRDTLDLYGELSAEQRRAVPPALFVIAEGDPIGEGSLAYEAALRADGVPTEVKTYAGALHGFIEENNPEYAPLHSHASMSPEQEVMARDAETYIGEWIQRTPAAQ